MRVSGRIALYLVLAVSIILLFISFDLKPVVGDEGILAMDGYRISKGEVPHRDFFQFIPPLAAYVQAFFFTLLGTSVFAVRVLGLVYGLLILVTTYIFYSHFIKKQLFLAVGLSLPLPFGLCYWYFGSHQWLCDILQIIGAIFLLSAVRRRSAMFSVFAGIFLGLAAFTLQDQGGYAVLGLLIGAFAIPRNERKFLLIAPAAAIAAFLLLALPFAVLAGPSQLFRDWIAFPLFNYRTPGGNILSMSSIWNIFAENWAIIGSHGSVVHGVSAALGKSFIFLTPVLSLAASAMILKRKSLEPSRMVIMTVFTLSFLFCAFHRFALTNLAWAFPALLPFFILLEKGSEADRKPVKWISTGAAFTLLAITLVYGVTRIMMDTRKERFTGLLTPAGQYRLLYRNEAESLQQLVDAVEKNVPDGEPMFCAGYIPLVNFMTLHPNPTRFNFMLPGGYYSKMQVILWRESLETNSTAWGIGERVFLDEKAGAYFLPGYRAAFKNDRYILWKRENAKIP